MTIKLKTFMVSCIAFVFPVVLHADLGSLYDYVTEHPSNLHRIIPCIWGDSSALLENTDKDSQISEEARICQELSELKPHLRTLGINVFASCFIARNLRSDTAEIAILYVDMTLVIIILEYAYWLAPRIRNSLVEIFAIKLNELIPTPPL